MKIHMALDYITIPAKHRLDCFRYLGMVGFVDAARVHPEVFDVISGLFATELELCIPRLATIESAMQIAQGHFISIWASTCEKNRVGWTIVHRICSQGDSTTTFLGVMLPTKQIIGEGRNKADGQLLLPFFD